MVGSILVLFVLIHNALLHSMCNLKAAQMTVQCSQSSKWPIKLRKQEKIFVEGESTVDYSTVMGHQQVLSVAYFVLFVWLIVIGFGF